MLLCTSTWSTLLQDSRIRRAAPLWITEAHSSVPQSPSHLTGIFGRLFVCSITTSLLGMRWESKQIYYIQRTYICPGQIRAWDSSWCARRPETRSDSPNLRSEAVTMPCRGLEQGPCEPGKCVVNLSQVAMPCHVCYRSESSWGVFQTQVRPRMEAHGGSSR